MFAQANVTREPVVFLGIGSDRTYASYRTYKSYASHQSYESATNPPDQQIDHFPIRLVLPPPLIVRLIFLATFSASANTRMKFPPRILSMSCSL